MSCYLKLAILLYYDTQHLNFRRELKFKYEPHIPSLKYSSTLYGNYYSKARSSENIPIGYSFNSVWQNVLMTHDNLKF